MKLRKINIKDYPKLIEFWKEHYFVGELDEYKPFKLFLEKNPDMSFLIEDKGKIIGTVLGSFDGRRGYIQKLVVSKAYRGKGLGKQLTDKCIKKLKSIGALYIPINCEIDNARFYEKNGFKKTGQVAMSISLS